MLYNSKQHLSYGEAHDVDKTGVVLSRVEQCTAYKAVYGGPGCDGLMKTCLLTF